MKKTNNSKIDVDDDDDSELAKTVAEETKKDEKMKSNADVEKEDVNLFEVILVQI